MLSTEINDLSTVFSTFNAAQLIIGILLGIFIALLAWRVKALSGSGAWAASLTGGFIFGLGGLPWAGVLMTFFISSSLLSRLFAARKRVISEKYAKGSQRDWSQVFANGGLGILLVILYALYPHAIWLWVAFVGAMAAVNADTWATELGVLNPRPPRLITNGKRVERGASGGISMLGYIAVLVGAGLVGGVGALFSMGINGWALWAAAVLGGVAGASVDSLLGATVQGIYTCPVCQKETERHPLHSCGARTVYRRGWRWVTNEVVNFICSLTGAGAAIGAWWLLL